MDNHILPTVHKTKTSGVSGPVTEADLHAYADDQLDPNRVAIVEEFLRTHPHEQECINTWREQNRLLHRLLDPVRDEPIPLRLALHPAPKRFPWSALAASIVIAIVSGGSAWFLRGQLEASTTPAVLAAQTPATSNVLLDTGTLQAFAQRAVVAHTVYSHDARRPVEVSADQEQALVTWLTKRMGVEVKPPSLTRLGYTLIGGRLLPGEQGPVAQFMYDTAAGRRLTLYVTRELPSDINTSFQFSHYGTTNVFYWVENNFGYALSADADKAELMRVSQAVYAQMQTP